MNIVKIASLSESGKVAYTAANVKAFVPARFRGSIEGQYALVHTETINVSKKDENGEAIMENGQVVLSGETAQRDTVTFVGTFKDCVAAKNESSVLAKAEAVLIGKLANEKAVELGLTEEELTSAI
jgi:hypothetical protein